MFIALTTLIKSPLVHFLLIGLLLWCGLNRISGEQRVIVEPLSVSEVAQLADQWHKKTGRQIDSLSLEALVNEQYLERVMLAEAVKRGFHRQDSVVRQRLIVNMQFIEDDGLPVDDATYIEQAIALGMVNSDLVIRRRLVHLVEQNMLLGKEVPLTDEQIEQYYRQHKDSFLWRQKIALDQLFFSHDSKASYQRATNARESLLSGSAEQALQSDMFIHGGHFALQSEQQYQRVMGADFAGAIQSLALAQWSVPIASSYGWHLVKPTERRQQQQKTLPEVRAEIIVTLKRQQHRALLIEQKQRLLQRYKQQGS